MLANGLAFSALFAAIPTVLLVLGFAGWAASGDPAIHDQVSDALVAAFPPLAALIRSSLDAITEGAALTSLIGVIGLLWTVSQFFGAMDTAFARIFSGLPERDVFRRTALGFVTVALMGAVIVVVIAALATLAALDALAGTQRSLARGAVDVLTSSPFVGLASCLAVTVAYRKLPPRSPTWRALLIPAVVVGVVLVILSQAFTILVPWLVGVADLAGPLASGFAALAWLSFSFQAFLLGAAWVRVRDEPRAAPTGEGRVVGSADLEGPAPATEPGRRRE
ncbi:MAG TPA: YihY/virulence factor BrkB family protein [Arenibaculum sp.]|nr:YihY/virulence factor BrkB family protein [Arenibaculum sp.]